MVIVIILMAIIPSLPFWIDANSSSENNNFLYTAIFFWITGIAYLFSFGFLVAEAQKINDKAWIPLTIIMVACGYILNRNFGGVSARIENKVTGIFSEPIMWLLIASLIGHLFLFIYKRNKPQMG